jgi:hypothetical protein
VRAPAPINRRLVLFAAVMTALLGALFASTLRYLGQPDVGRLRFESGFYRAYYRRTPLLGAALGAALGAGFAVISQTARRRAAPVRPLRDRR